MKAQQNAKAEDAVKGPIFVDAVTKMSFADARGILMERKFSN
jgi:hypothetical protein